MNLLHRRNEGKWLSLLMALLVILAGCGAEPAKDAPVETATPPAPAPAADPETALGWKLGAQSYTFNKFTLSEAIDKIDSCGLRYVEAYPQEIGGGIAGKFDYTIDEATRAKVLQKLKDKNVKLVAYGVVRPETEADWKKLFEFGKAMGIETFTAEPHEKHLQLISDLCDQYNINVAIHNHPQPSKYWNPENVLAAIKGKSKRFGACADIGHWVRSGLDPVKCLEKLNGHVLHLHMKDLNDKNGEEDRDVHWGTGVANTDGVIRELKKQQFKGIISAEYESNWLNNVPDVTASVQYFRNALK